MTNSERRISRVRSAVPGPGEARDDWRSPSTSPGGWKRDCEPAYLARMRTLFPYSSPEEIFREHVATTAGRDLDITGLSYALLDDPRPAAVAVSGRRATAGRQRLYVDGVFATPDGRARFAAMPYVPVAEKPDARHPFRLNTGRLRDQWHGMSRTGTVAQLFQNAGEPRLQLQCVRSCAARDRSRRPRLRRVEARPHCRSGRGVAPN